jgi:hypothetical protein
VHDDVAVVRGSDTVAMDGVAGHAAAAVEA